MVGIPLRLPCWGIYLLQLPDSFKIVYVSLDDVIYSVYLKPRIWQSGTNFYFYLRRATWPIVLLLQLGNVLSRSPWCAYLADARHHQKLRSGTSPRPCPL